jgi:integrase/recombinase XerD
MSAWPYDNGDAIERYLRQLPVRSTVKDYRWVLRGFQRFVQHRTDSKVSEATVQAWLHEHAASWLPHLVLWRGRIVDRFLDFLESEAAIPRNPLAELRVRYGQRASTPVVRALLAADPAQALEALRPQPRFASFLGGMIREHIELKRVLGFRYEKQAQGLLRFDRFLQGRPDLVGQPLPMLLQQWAAQCQTLQQTWVCELAGRQLAQAWRRLDPSAELPARDSRLQRLVKQQDRHPYIYTSQELRLLLDTAREFPSRGVPLRPLALYTMMVLAGCAGLRLGELARLDLGDVHLDTGELDIRQTKFFKSRTLPLADSVTAALREYLEARRRAGAPQDGRSALFWHRQAAGRYSRSRIEQLLVRVLRRAGLKPEPGRRGPRIHDLRHAFVVHRMLTWYRQGINPQARLPYLATYLGHKDINSTLVYLTVTQELLQHAGERFRGFVAHSLDRVVGVPQ